MNERLRYLKNAENQLREGLRVFEGYYGNKFLPEERRIIFNNGVYLIEFIGCNRALRIGFDGGDFGRLAYLREKEIKYSLEPFENLANRLILSIRDYSSPFLENQNSFWWFEKSNTGKDFISFKIEGNFRQNKMRNISNFLEITDEVIDSIF